MRKENNNLMRMLWIGLAKLWKDCNNNESKFYLKINWPNKGERLLMIFKEFSASRQANIKLIFNKNKRIRTNNKPNSSTNTILK